MSSEAERTAGLLANAREALERYLDVRVDDDGALTFRHADVPCAVQAMQLVDGLSVLTLSCVVAWDLPDDTELAASVARRAGDGLFGALGVVRSAKGLDVTLRYTFPAEGLDPAALGTLLMLVVSAASQTRAELVRT